ncbi:hydroxymethylglutaryl-CoA lyase [Tistrella mobilis]|uniref:hydroxymethylglutaryl-CoA lyase n=1 Tax=Tistrella mobilis TaxID=171437 RepID=UPI0031F6174F
MSDRVTITEVGLRDGLQNQPVHVATADKLRLAGRLLEAGLTSLEVTSFVSPKAVPQLADADALLAGLPVRAGVDYMALVPNMRGYERGTAAGARAVALVLSATETLNRRNINMSLDQARTVCREVIGRAKAEGVFVRAYVAAACACPYEGQTPLARVVALTEEMFAAGADQVAIADTIGAGNPAQIRDIVAALAGGVGTDRLALHLHDTRGLALAMAWAGLEAGIRRFDAAFGGLGGCPFAPGAAGNLATEDLVFMLSEAGIETGIDWRRLFDAVALAETLLDRPLGGRMAAWWRQAQAKEAQAKEAQAKEAARREMPA